jgi:serine/threonine-protein kinase PpkA
VRTSLHAVPVSVGRSHGLGYSNVYRMKNLHKVSLALPGYRIERLLGQGGMAVVYLALQESLDRHVALKVMRQYLSAEPGFRKRFLNEARIIAQLSHPNIITVFDVGVYELNYYLSMDYLSGGTLKERIRQGLPTASALKIARTLAVALGYAHRRGYVHRDIKPANVLFDAYDQPVLTDFGVAKMVGDGATRLTSTGTTLGSAAYMSPEQAKNRPVDQRSDLYSFGVLFWESLTATLPFQAQNPFALALKHINDPIPKLPPNLEAFQPIVDGLLAKEPEQRFANAAELLKVLDFLSADVAPDRDESPGEMSTQMCTRVVPTFRGHNALGRRLSATMSRNVKIGLTLGLTVVLAVGIFAILGRNRGTEPPTLALKSPDAPSVSLVSENQTPLVDPDASKNGLTTSEAGAPNNASQATTEKSASKSADNLTKTENPVQVSGQARMHQLLIEARTLWQAGKLTEPEGDNAFERYRQVLAIDPQNSKARAKLVELGRIRLARRYLQTARTLLAQQDLEGSLTSIETGLRLAENHQELLALRDQVQATLADETPERIKQRSVARLLERAATQWQMGQLTEPAGDNAYESYRQILRIDPGHSEAKAKLIRIGRIRLVAQYRTAAEQLLHQGDLRGSLAKIEVGLRLAPDQQDLKALREKVEAQMAAAAP